MEQIQQLFNDLFKFQNNESLRHRGDGKGGKYTSTDLGLLVVARVIQEDVDDNGNQVYERLYHCRIIQFSQSGNIQQFKERELMSMEEFRKAQAEEEREREEMHEEHRRTTAEIYASYGVSKKSKVKLKADKEHEYEVNGFKGKDHVYELSLREIGGFGKSIYIQSPDEIESVA
jgi:hypothetical protein